MYEPVKALTLRVLKVPPEPHPPSGSPGSLRVFRAARNYYRYKLALWGLKQIGAVVGLVAFLSLRPIFDGMPVPSPIHKALTGAKVVAAPVDPESGETRRLRVGDIAHLLLILEALGLAAFVLQLPFTYVHVRLDYEARWYLVTDRSLRIREGVWHVSEMTMTFANVQNLTIEQGPIQRLLGIADLHVKTAGGGGAADLHAAKQGRAESMHEGYFRGVDNADEIRDLVLALLKRYRGAGLGDPEETRHDEEIAGSTSGAEGAAVEAARELLAEARAVRRALGRAS